MDQLDSLIKSDSIQRAASLPVPKELLLVPKVQASPALMKATFIGTSAAKKLTRPYLGIPNEVWPGVLSTDERFVAFRAKLDRECTAAYPAKIDSQGFVGSNGVPRDFTALRSCSGVKMTPSNAPVTDRRKMLEVAGLSDGYATPRHQRLARILHRLMFGSRKRGASFHFSNVSSTSNPFFEYDATWKKTMALYNLEHAEELLDLVAKDDFAGLHRHGWQFMATLVERHQPEGGQITEDGRFIPKKRMVADMQYALSGGTRGRMLEADKITPLKPWGVAPDTASAMRVRTAYGFAAGPTYFISCLLAGVREQYYENYAFTWHHTTPEQIQGKIAGAETIVGLDVTTMDQFFPAFLLDDHASWLGEYFDPRVAKLISLVNYAPYFAPSLGPGLAPYWAGNPFDKSTFKVDVGLSSGRADNPDLGKYYMTWALSLIHI